MLYATVTWIHTYKPQYSCSVSMLSILWELISATTLICNTYYILAIYIIHTPILFVIHLYIFSTHRQVCFYNYNSPVLSLSSTFQKVLFSWLHQYQQECVEQTRRPMHHDHFLIYCASPFPLFRQLSGTSDKVQHVT
jgi:hypothetical protein